MGFSQKAAVLTVASTRPYYYYSRSLNFRFISDSTIKHDCILSYERKFGGTVINPKLFLPLLKQFKSKLDSYKNLKLDEQIVTIQIPFAVAGDEEFFIDNIYRNEQQKLFSRLHDKASKAIERLCEENIILCTSGITDYVVLYK